jgi:putative phosphoesterase
VQKLKLLIISDIHGNLAALRETLNYVDRIHSIDICAILGDVIDYGMHSNEVVQMLREMRYPLVCNIHGNHEYSIINNDYSNFSSERGIQCAQYTHGILNSTTWDYINNSMTTSGMAEFIINEKKCLAVHGSLKNIYWKSIDFNHDLSDYQKYDYVFSGHSHLPHFNEVFYKTNNPAKRNLKKTIFINPGSVGQPRNLIPMAQCAVLDLDTEDVYMLKTIYDIKMEQAAYHGQVDDFYKQRLELGI